MIEDPSATPHQRQPSMSLILLMLVVSVFTTGFQSPAHALEDAVWAFLKAGAQAGDDCDTMADHLAAWRQTHEPRLNARVQAVVAALESADPATLDAAQAWLQTLGSRLSETDAFRTVSACQNRHDGVKGHVDALMDMGLIPAEQALETALQTLPRDTHRPTLNEPRVRAALSTVAHYTNTLYRLTSAYSHEHACPDLAQSLTWWIRTHRGHLEGPVRILVRDLPRWSETHLATQSATQRADLDRQRQRIQANLAALAPLERCLEALANDDSATATRHSLQRSQGILQQHILTPLATVIPPAD